MNVPRLPSLLGVFAHPDDESLLAGGVLAQHHAVGARTAVVTTTWGPGADEVRNRRSGAGSRSSRAPP